MSLDFNFNKSLTTEEIKEKTTLKVEDKESGEFLLDKNGNAVFFKGYGITAYAGNNPSEILSELYQAFGVMFIDDHAIEKYDYEPEKYENIDLFLETMIKYGLINEMEITDKTTNQSCKIELYDSLDWSDLQLKQTDKLQEFIEFEERDFDNLSINGRKVNYQGPGNGFYIFCNCE